MVVNCAGYLQVLQVGVHNLSEDMLEKRWNMISGYILHSQQLDVYKTPRKSKLVLHMATCWLALRQTCSIYILQTDPNTS